MKYKFNFNLNAWIDMLEIEADNEEEAYEKLHNLSINDIIENGNVHDYEIDDIDVEENGNNNIELDFMYDYNERINLDEDEFESVAIDFEEQVSNIDEISYCAVNKDTIVIIGTIDAVKEAIELGETNNNLLSNILYEKLKDYKDKLTEYISKDTDIDNNTKIHIYKMD